MPHPTADPSALVLLRSLRGLPCAKSLAMEDGRPVVSAGYGKETAWAVESVPVPTFAAMAAALQAASGRGNCIVIRGALPDGFTVDPEKGVPRRLPKSPRPGPWEPAAGRTWIPIDLDGVTIPAGLTGDCRIMSICDRLPAPFRGVSCWYQYTSSHGLDGDPSRARIRLWFHADRPVADGSLVALFAPLAESLRVDVSIYRTVQPIYVARPTLAPGMADPVPDRTGIVEGFDGDTVDASTFPEATARASTISADAFFQRARDFVPNPVEIANQRERILAGSTTGSRHHHALGAAVDFLAFGASASEAALLAHELISRQGREPAPGEIDGIIQAAMERHAAGTARVDHVPAAELFARAEAKQPAAAPGGGGSGTEPPADDGGEGGGDEGGGGFEDFAPRYSANSTLNAEAYLRAHHALPSAAGVDGWGLVDYGGNLMEWTGKRYAPVEDSAIPGRIQKRVRVAVTQTAVAVRRLAHVERKPGESMPRWRTAPRPEDPPAGALVPFDNGLLDLREWKAGRTVLRPHDCRLLSMSLLPYAFDPAAECPTFDAWLSSLFADEEQRAEYLKMLGYMFLDENPFHRMFILSGVPRSGKGLTLELIRGLIGPESCASPLLPSLSERFGMAPLLGKRAALVPEMNEGRRPSTNEHVAVDRMKAISGGNAVPVEAKGKDIIEVLLPVRFVIACNNLPDLLDDSGAIIDRMSVFRFKVSHKGKEDTTLTGRLLSELPGIANRALAALRVLLAEGFKTPPAVADFVAGMRGGSAPLLDFAEACIVDDPAADFRTLDAAPLYAAYRGWSAQYGIERPLSRSRFEKTLAETAPAVLERYRTRPAEGPRRWAFRGRGLRLTAAGEALANGNACPFG